MLHLSNFPYFVRAIISYNEHGHKNDRGDVENSGEKFVWSITMLNLELGRR